MNNIVDAAVKRLKAAEQLVVGGVDDGIGAEGGDVALPERDVGQRMGMLVYVDNVFVLYVCDAGYRLLAELISQQAVDLFENILGK